ncbi:MAG TPA: isoprenylcysteine carboxylmethyltransferase family protein [Nakamurella sp.]
MIMARLVIQLIVWLAGTGALLFVPAGTLDWPAAWVFLAELAVVGIGAGLWLARSNLSLLKERMSAPVQREQKSWDKALMGLVMLLWTGWYVLMGFDIRANGTDQIPVAIQVVAALALLLSVGIVLLTFRENSYAAPVVKLQKERGQTVVTTGPYGLVRHPIYTGAVVFFLTTPLLLGSWWGLALAPVIIVVLALRSVLEERTLTAELAGYGDYVARVRYRLVPLVW